MWTSVVRWPRRLALVAVVVLAVVSVASASWLWEPRIQVTDTALPDYGAIPERAQPGRTADVAMHLVVRVWDNEFEANTWGRGYYVRLHPDSTWESAWTRRELFTNIEEGLGGSHRSSTDHHLVEDSGGDIHLVSEVRPHPRGTGTGPFIGYKHRNGPHWSSDSLSFLVGAPDIASLSPELFLQSGATDTLHVMWRRSGAVHYSRKSTAVADSLWDDESLVLASGTAAVLDFVVDDTGLVHFFGTRSSGGTTSLVDLHGFYPGAGQQWSLSESVIHQWTTALVEPEVGLDEGGALLAGPYLYYSFVAPDPTTGIVEVFLSRLNLSVTPFDWDTPVQVSRGDGVQSRGVTLVVDSGAGALHVMFQEPKGGPNEVGQAWAPDDTTRIYHTFSRDPMNPGGWSTPTEVVPERRTTSGRPVYVARGDTVRVAWISADDDFPVAGSDDDYEVWVRTGHAIADTLKGTDVTWSGLVYLDSDFEVQAGKTLTIEPGTRILAEAGSGSEKVDLIVNGRLVAIGTAYDPIRFAPYRGGGGAGEWGGIRFSAGIDSRLEHVEIQGADQPIALVGGRADLLHLTVTDVTAGNADVVLDRDVKVGSGESWELAGLLSVAAEYPDAANQGRDAARVEIIVQGSLDAQGDALQDMTFGAASGQAGDWAGVLFDLAAAPSGYGFTTNSFIKGTEIRDATQGIAIRQTGAPSLDGVTFSNVVQDRHIVLDSTDVYLPYEGAWILTPGSVIKAAPVTRTGSDIGSPGAFLHAGKVDLVVHGRMHGVGDALAPIRFEPVDVPGDTETTAGDEWGGIFFDWISAGASMHLLRFADIGYAATPLSLYYGDAVIEDCRIHHFKDRGIWMKSSFTWGPEIRRCSVFRDTTGTATLDVLSGRDGIVINDVLDATIEENTIRLAGMEGPAGGAAIVVENAGGKFGFCLGTTAQPETLRVSSNTLVGPGGDEPTGSATWSGVKGTWMCGSGVRKVEVTENVIEGWNGAGITLLQTKDVQFTCNEVRDCFDGVDFSRNTDVTGPPARFRANVLRVGAYGGLNPDQDVARTDNSPKLALGPGTSDKGSNQLVADGADWFIRENDDTTAALNAASNYWRRNGLHYTLPDTIRAYFRTTVADSIIVDVSNPLEMLPDLCGASAMQGPRSALVQGGRTGDALAADAFGDADLPDRTDLTIVRPTGREVEIRFALSGREERAVVVEVFNVAGRRVETVLSRQLGGGRYGVTWSGTARDGSRVGAGVYLIRMRAGDETRVRKAVLVR